MTAGWNWAQAEAHLASLEPFGWRLGLERMRRLLSALGMPQHRFASIHVVGTNGKSSVARAAAALLEAAGTPAGAYLSPHFERWTERVLVRGEEIEPEAMAAAIERVAQAAEAVDRALPEGEAVTQFELFTAAAFVALAAAGVEAAAIEAGLGGRLDATNTIPSRVTVLTSVSLDHTELLGETEQEIAAEKLAVVRDHSTLVLGPVGDAVDSVAEDVARRHAARVVRPEPLDPGLAPRGRGECVRRDFALALAAVEEVAGPLRSDTVERVARGLELPGVCELRDGDPPLVLDSAHNVDGARALAAALPELSEGRPVVACVAVLEGKDAAGIAHELAPSLAGAICTEVEPDRLRGVGRPGSRSVPAERLAELFRESGAGDVRAVVSPAEALSAARDSASALRGAALVAGTHYLLPYAWTGTHAPTSSR